MYISRVKLKNWRNFQDIDVELSKNRVFIVGPNASGKSNFLDVFKFLRDISKQGGGLQAAINERGGLSKIRCLFARKKNEVEIEIHLSESEDKAPIWKYSLSLLLEQRGIFMPYIKHEKVWDKDDKIILDRPEKRDKDDKELLYQTHLEQPIINQKFREIAKFFQSVQYLHLVPQLIRYPKAFTGAGITGDPYGQSFMNQLSKEKKNIRGSRLRKIEKALSSVVPHLKDLKYDVDETGTPHLETAYENWRPRGAKQREDQFSDGTLRLIGLFWSLLETDPVLLLEEPELSLNAEIVRKLPAIMSKIQRERKKQVILSTHSLELLQDRGIGGEEVLVLSPKDEGTNITQLSGDIDIRRLLITGMSVGDIIQPKIRPPKLENLHIAFG